MSTRKISTLALLGVWARDMVNGRVYNPVFTDDLIVGGNSTEYASGTELKMFFSRTKGAFRAGSVSSTQWNSASVGATSAAFGVDCTASGAQAFAVGNASTASGAQSVALGTNHVASGDNSFAAGTDNTASGAISTTLGQAHTASGRASLCTGIAAIAFRYGQTARGRYLSAFGDSQANTFLAAKSTTTATPAVLYFDAGASATLTGTSTNVLTVPVSKAHRFTINAIARRTDSTSDVGGWTITGTIARGASGNATFVSTPAVVADLTAGASAWTLAVTIDTSNATNNYLVITATGQAGATIKWVADIATVEVG